MSAPRSKQAQQMRKWDKMDAQYRERIERQKHIIDRLIGANTVQGDALHDIVDNAKDVRQARAIAKRAQANVAEVLKTEEK